MIRSQHRVMLNKIIYKRNNRITCIKKIKKIKINFKFVRHFLLY